MTDSAGSGDRRRPAAVAIAGAASALWLAGTGLLVWILGSDSALWLAIAVAVALPLVALWFAALLARQSARLDAQAARLSEAGGAMRNSVRGTSRPEASAVRRDPIRLSKPEPPMRLTPGPAAPVVLRPAQPRQERLPFSDQLDAPQVGLADLIRALDFPDSAEDKDGFRALRLALADPKARRLVQASQDVLTLLSEEGIYMDDLDPDHARPEIWRRFAAGERGAAVGRVGGIRDRSSLALSAARMRSDPVFRDAAHHFLRLFDKSLAEIAPVASDAELAKLADSRTARAFMLIGRVAALFE